MVSRPEMNSRVPVAPSQFSTYTVAPLSTLPLGGRKCSPGHWNRVVVQFGAFAVGLRNALTLNPLTDSWAMVKTSTMTAYGAKARAISRPESRSAGRCSRT